MNGNDRITINPAGDIITEGKINRSGLGTADFLPICYGRIDENGSILSGTGNFSVTRNNPGSYTIFVTGENTTKVALVTPFSPGYSASVSLTAPPYNISVIIQNNYTLAQIDGRFNFVVYRQ